MRFSIFNSPKAQQGELCTYEKYLEVSNSAALLTLCNDIAAETDKDKRAELKKRLPVITWQAFFPGKRLAKEAQPSGLFMLDIDHVDNPGEMYNKQVAGRVKELGIVYVGMTASRHGLRIVAKCRPTLTTIADCQKWLASNLKVEYDGVCKDFARCSFLVHDSYTYYMDAKAIWQDEPEEGTVYSLDSKPEMVGELLPPADPKDINLDQREGLFGGSDTYEGVTYDEIIHEWFESTGGEPHDGNRNARIYELATRLRYITDFSGASLLRLLPTYGLPVDEMRSIVKSALTTTRRMSMPRDLKDIIDRLKKREELKGDDDIELPDVTTSTAKLPPLPPVIREYTACAPEDFKQAVILCQLPILGTLASKLRAEYLDGQMHSPSFQVSLEAPQASGKSFMTRMAETELAQVIEHDNVQREKELEYDKKVRELKLLNIKVNADNKEEILGSRPKSLIRYCSPKMSITKLLMRLNDAQGLHVFAIAPEIDTVTKAFKAGFSNYSDLLRVAFDNGYYGQDYASENSFSGIVNVYYNVLFSGTPKAMRRFYPDVEDGLVSRVCFVTLPDQFGKPMPIWKELNPEQKAIVDVNLVRLNEVSLIGDEVQPDHVLKLHWLNVEMEKWIRAQQVEALQQNDRTRDIFCRRAAVVGFRAGMLAFFLYGEPKRVTPTIRRNVIAFAIWVANSMLNQHLLRFNIQTTHSNTIPWEEVLNTLADEFSRDDVERALAANGVETSVKAVLYKWKLAGLVESTKEGRAKSGKKQSVKFKKIGK